MNKFTQTIPNYFDGFKTEVFDFTDIGDLANKLGKDKSTLAYDDEHILWVSEDETQWWVLGRVENKVVGLREWRGSPHLVVEIESVHGWGLDTFEAKVVSDPFTIYSKEDIKCYWGFGEGIMGELKDGSCFLGVDK